MLNLPLRDAKQIIVSALISMPIAYVAGGKIMEGFYRISQREEPPISEQTAIASGLIVSGLAGFLIGRVTQVITNAVWRD